MPVARLHQPAPDARGRRARPSGRWSRAVLAAFLVASMTFSVSDQVRPADAGVAPACRYADVLTRYRAQGDWYRSLLDTKYRLASTSAPLDLVSVGRSGASGYGYIRKVALADLTAMYRAASVSGAPFAVQSAYRSYSSQVATFNSWVRKMGYSKALLASARPGHSEHQLGTALDLKTPGGAAPWNYTDWGQTKAGTWLRRNSWRYGWVMSYSKSKSPSATCYKYEPWHFRYVGRTIAARIRSSTLAPREWLYLKGATTTWSGGLPNPTPSPAPTPSPSPSAQPSETPSETPSESPSETPSETPSQSPAESPSAAASGSPSASPGTDGGPGASDGAPASPEAPAETPSVPADEAAAP